MHNFIDMRRRKLEYLEVIKRLKSIGGGKSRWLVKCICEKTFSADGFKLRSGEIRSCGCLKGKFISEKVRRHGMSQTHFHKKFMGIVQRCTDPNPKGDFYSKYFGRGIGCEWKSFEEFRDDMYESYLAHVKEFGEKETTIERIDNDGNYSKKNCRWATNKEQAINKRTTHFLSLNGVTKPLCEWEKETGFDHRTILMRLKKGWSEEMALTTPINGRYRKKLRGINAAIKG